MPCTRQRHALGGSRYSPADANRLWTGLHPRPAPRSPTRCAPRGRLRHGVHRQGLREARPPPGTRPGLALGQPHRRSAGDHQAGPARPVTGAPDRLSKGLRACGVGLVVLDQGIDTSTAVGRMFFQILGSIAEFEHALMSERTIDGRAAARARRTGGQKPKLGGRQVTRRGRCTKRPGMTGSGVTPSRRSRQSSASLGPPSTVTCPTPASDSDRRLHPKLTDQRSASSPGGLVNC
jgi:hypothetical protein